MGFDPELIDFLFNPRRQNHDWDKPSLKVKTRRETRVKKVKGECRYCGKKIGRGISAHELHCPERDD